MFNEATRLLGYDLLDVCVNGPADRLNSTAVSQPAIFVVSLAALEELRLPANSRAEELGVEQFAALFARL